MDYIYKDYIYAIIKDTNSETLSKVSRQITHIGDIPESELCKYHAYATNLSDQYSSSIPAIPESNLNICNKGIRAKAVAFEYATEELHREYGDNVIAVSHRRGGWCGIDWAFNEDITFCIETNFGFGSVSYFYAVFKYKKLLITPYSFYLKYKNSTYASVIRCTYEYELEYDRWSDVMDDCIEFYNAIVFGNKSYIISWIDSQLSEMVSGLEKLMGQNDPHFVDCSINKHHASRYAVIYDDDLLIIKSKKIAYSLEFIDNIRQLPAEIDSVSYINRLQNLCENFHPFLETKIRKNESLLARLKSDMEKMKTENDYLIYDLLQKKYYLKKKWNLLCNNKLRMVLFLIRIYKRINHSVDFQEIKSRIAQLKQLLERISSLENKIMKTEYLLKNLNEDSNFILQFFNKRH